MRDDSRRERRISRRAVVVKEIHINGGAPYKGGRLRDISTTGASIEYPKNVAAIGLIPVVGEQIVLESDDSHRWPGRVVRLFDGGYAVRFDWEQNVMLRRPEPD